MWSEWKLVREVISGWKHEYDGSLHSGFRPITQMLMRQNIALNQTQYQFKMYGEIYDLYRVIYGVNYSFRLNYNQTIQDFNGNVSLTGVSTGQKVYIGESSIKTIQNNSDGSTPMIFIQNGGYCYVQRSISGAETDFYNYTSDVVYYQAPDIPRGSIISSIINTENNQASIPVKVSTEIQINYNKYIDDSYDKLVVKLGTETITTKTGLSNHYKFNFNSSEINKIQELISDKNSDKLKFILSTYEDDNFETQIGVDSEFEIDALIVEANPTITSCMFDDINSATLLLTGNSKYIIKGHSNVKFSSLIASALQYATLENVYINGNIYNYVDDFEAIINNYGLTNANVFVIDSRTNSSNKYSMTFSNFINYFNIIKNASSYERTGFTDECIFSFAGQFFNYNFGQVNNDLSITYRYKDLSDTSDDNWINGTTTIIPTKNNNNFSFEGAIKGDTDEGFDVGKSFKVEIIVSDSLSSATYSFDVIAGIPVIDIYKSSIALAGNYDESESESAYKIQVKDKSKFYSDAVFDKIYSNEIYENDKQIATIEYVNNKILTTAIESGSNENGNYVKFENGIMICYKQVNVNQALSANFFYTWPGTSVNCGAWPINFVDDPIVNMTWKTISSSYVGLFGQDSSSNSFVGNALLFRPAGGTAYGQIQVTGYGHWK